MKKRQLIVLGIVLIAMCIGIILVSGKTYTLTVDERNLRVALTGEAGITAACPSAVGIDAQVIERHLGTFGNRNLHISAECAR